MRILWVGKQPNKGDAGDEIYDRKMIAAAEIAGAQISRVYPQRTSRLAQLANAIKGVAHYRTFYDSNANRKALQKSAAGFRIAVCSGESFDRLATGLPCAVIPILHNVTSQSLRSMLPHSPVARLLSLQAFAWERSAYAVGRFPLIAVVSRDDQAYLSQIRPRNTVLYTPPGMPVLVQLRPEARFKREILLSGTFDWYPKRRDVTLFSHDYGAWRHAFPVFGDPLPSKLQEVITARPMISKFDDAVRLGLIPDRFVAGHKLKATFYIAHNAIVLSYANISSEFQEIEDHQFFVRTISNAADIETHAEQISALSPEALRYRMEAFKSRCAQRFSWDSSARTLLASCESIGAQG